MFHVGGTSLQTKQLFQVAVLHHYAPGGAHDLIYRIWPDAPQAYANSGRVRLILVQQYRSSIPQIRPPFCS